MAQLPRLGLLACENTVPARNAPTRRWSIRGEDEAAGQLWVYAGDKQGAGSPIDRAGLTNGALIRRTVAGATTDEAFRAAYAKGSRRASTCSDMTEQARRRAHERRGQIKGLSLNRIEDGHWDPTQPERLLLRHHGERKGRQHSHRAVRT